MLYLFLIIIVLGLLAAMLTAFAKLIRDLGELAALMRASGSGTENNAGQDKNSSANNGNGVANGHPFRTILFTRTGVITKTKTAKTGKNLSTK